MYSPAEVARRYVETGKSKAALPVGRMLLLGMLAGAFIALAGGSATFAVSYGGGLAGAALAIDVQDFRCRDALAALPGGPRQDPRRARMDAMQPVADRRAGLAERDALDGW